MVPYDDTTPATRFDRFNVYSTSYKKVREREIGVGILVPKELKPGKCPVIVKWHGGGLVSSSLFLALYEIPTPSNINPSSTP
jgi:cephalosporin-C deacetylase-like acetyl esterase